MSQFTWMVFNGCCPSLNNEEKNASDNFKSHLKLPVADLQSTYKSKNDGVNCNVNVTKIMTAYQDWFWCQITSILRHQLERVSARHWQLLACFYSGPLSGHRDRFPRLIGWGCARRPRRWACLSTHSWLFSITLYIYDTCIYYFYSYVCLAHWHSTPRMVSSLF